MNNSVIYISRRCQYCQELLILIHKNRDILKFRVVDIDREAFPKSVTTVPSMLIGEKILPGQELFKFLTYIINQKKGNNSNENIRSNMSNNQMSNNQMSNDQMSNNQMSNNYNRDVDRDMNRDMDLGKMDIGEMNRASMNNGEMNRGEMNRGEMNRGEMNQSNSSSDIVELDGFSSFGGGSDLGFSLLDDNDNDNNLDVPFEFLNSSSDTNSDKLQMSGSGNDYKSEKKKQFDNDYEEMMQSRGSLDSRNDNPMGGGGNPMSMRTF